jgi:hypothetical protein
MPACAHAFDEPDEIASVVSALADLLAVIRNADPAEKAEIYAKPGLRLTYLPQQQLAEAQLSEMPHWPFDGVRGPTPPRRPTAPAPIDSGLWLPHGSVNVEELIRIRNRTERRVPDADAQQVARAESICDRARSGHRHAHRP